MREKFFSYSPAFVAMVLSPTRIKFWPCHPQDESIDYKYYKAYEIDLLNTPNKRGIEWNDIEVDDHVNSEHRGYTSLGPLFPHAYCAAGVYVAEGHPAFVESDFMTANAIPPGRVEALRGRFYEKRALIREDLGKITRFHGFHVHKDLSPDNPQGNGKLLVVSHANTSYERRAPRIIQIPSDKYRPVDAGSSDLTGKGIYIERIFAQDVALLEVPKRPSGSGHGLLSDTTLIEGQPISGPDRSLNVFGASVSDETEKIWRRLDNNWTRLDGVDLKSLLSKLGGKDQYGSLDFIGHTRSGDGILLLGELPLTQDVVAKIFTSDVIMSLGNDHGIKQIRLIGCRTACSPESRAVIKYLVERLQSYRSNIQVLGTRGDIFAVHYDKGYGFVEGRLLVPQKVASKNGPGDPSPTDDEPVGLPTIQPTPSTPKLSDVTVLPSAHNTVARSNEYVLWSLTEIPFESLQKVIEWEVGRDEPDPAEIANRELVVVRDGAIYSLSVFNKGQNLRVRISFGNACYSYRITYVPGSPPDAQTQAIVKLLGI